MRTWRWFFALALVVICAPMAVVLAAWMELGLVAWQIDRTLRDTLRRGDSREEVGRVLAARGWEAERTPGGNLIRTEALAPAVWGQMQRTIHLEVYFDASDRYRDHRAAWEWEWR